MPQGFYLEETSYRLVEQLLFATKDLAAKIEVLTQQLTTGNKSSLSHITPSCVKCVFNKHCGILPLSDLCFSKYTAA